MENNKDLKYEYYLYTWGGFYNEHNKVIHGHEGGSRWFSTEENRNNYLIGLNLSKNALISGDAVLAVKTSEGYHTRLLPVIHRVVEYKGKRYYSKNTWLWPEDIITLEYHNEWKWTPGVNDEVLEDELQEEIDYNQVKIIQEWITGGFDCKHEEY